MAGEPILRSEIELNVAKYLDRAGDPVITGVTGLWFSQAHRKAQRDFNFSVMEGSELITPLTEGSEQYPIATALKEPTYGEIIDGTDRLIKYRKTDMATVDRYRSGGYREAVFGIEGRNYYLWPPTTQVTGRSFVVHGYVFMPTPALTDHDWLTDYGSDFLMYQCLLESVDYVSAPEGRLIAWQTRASEAFTELISMDTQFKIAGPMAVR